MNELSNGFFDGRPSVNGRYTVLANDIVSQWSEELDFIDGEWFMLCGNIFPCIIDGWKWHE